MKESDKKYDDDNNNTVDVSSSIINNRNNDDNDINTNNIVDNTELPIVINYLIDLKAPEYSTLSALLDLGLINLKYQLEKRGMKCSGNLQQRAERLFSIRDLASLEQINPKLLKKK